MFQTDLIRSLLQRKVMEQTLGRDVFSSFWNLYKTHIASPDVVPDVPSTVITFKKPFLLSVAL